KIGFPFTCGMHDWRYYYGTKRTGDLEVFWHNLPGAEAKKFFAPLILRGFVPPPQRGQKERSISKDLIPLLADIVNTADADIFMPPVILLSVFSSSRNSKEAPMLFDCIGSKLSVTSIYCESSEEREILRQVAKLLVNWLEQDSSR